MAKYEGREADRRDGIALGGSNKLLTFGKKLATLSRFYQIVKGEITKLRVE